MCTTFRGHDRFEAEVQALIDCAKAGTLTPEQLDQKMGLYYDDGDYINRSVGAEFISREPRLFAAMLDPEHRGEHRGWSVNDYLRRHFDTPHVVELLLCSEEVIRQLVHWNCKAEFVRDAYIHCGARNNDWVRAVLRNDVSSYTIAHAIMERLRRAEVRKDSVCNEATDFVSYGAGCVEAASSEFDRVVGWRFEKNTPWSVFNEKEILDAFMLCAEKDPQETLRHARTIAARVDGWINALPILSRAMQHTTSVRHVDLRILRLLPIHSKDFAYRMEYDQFREDAAHTIRFLTQTYLLLEERHDNRGAFFERAMRPVLDQVSAPVLYRHMNEYNLDARLWEYVNRRLKDGGYVVGNVSFSYHNNRGQWSLDLGNVRYVQDHNQHRYTPRKGELVAIDITRATLLTQGRHRVLRAMFVPLTRELKD